MTKKHASTKKVEYLLEADKAELEQIEKDIARMVSVLEHSGLKDFLRYLNSPWKIIWSNLLGGIFRGLGIIIGLTLVFAILLWILGKFVDFPLIGQYFFDIKALLEQFVPPKKGVF